MRSASAMSVKAHFGPFYFPPYRYSAIAIEFAIIGIRVSLNAVDYSFLSLLREVNAIVN
jgi:hypothetical protein